MNLRTLHTVRNEIVMNLRISLSENVAINFRAEPIVIGSDAACHLRVEGDRVGSRHAEIYAVGDLLWLRDLGSEDGTYLNGEIVDASPVAIPSVVRLGSEGPTLRLDRPSAPVDPG